jgi:hypothetical protein
VFGVSLICFFGTSGLGNHVEADPESLNRSGDTAIQAGM